MKLALALLVWLWAWLWWGFYWVVEPLWCLPLKILPLVGVELGEARFLALGRLLGVGFALKQARPVFLWVSCQRRGGVQS